MKWMLTPVAAAAFVLPILPAHAAGPYDGNWIIEAPAVRGGGADYDLEACNPVRIEFQVKDNQVVGHLRRAEYSQSGTSVQTARPSQRGASPIQGTVAPDGSLTASWEGYRATGHLTGDTAEVQWRGQCGPRVATGHRIK